MQTKNLRVFLQSVLLKVKTTTVTSLGIDVDLTDGVTMMVKKAR